MAEIVGRGGLGRHRLDQRQRSPPGPETAAGTLIDLDEAASTARLENGVLELTLARKTGGAGRKLSIQ